MTNKSYDFIMDIVSREKIKLSSLESSTLEKLKNSNFDIAEADINNFASTFFISNSTITRFAQKLGFNGYTELKYALHNKNNQLRYFTQIRYNSILHKIKPLNQEIVDFIENFNKFEKIVVIGIGSSGLLANEFIYKMGEMGLYNTDYAKEPYKIDMLAKSLDENDLMICLSLSGENINIVRGAKVASEQKATILSISGNENAPLSKYSDYFIKVPNYSTHEYSISKIYPILLYIDIICELYSKSIKK